MLFLSFILITSTIFLILCEKISLFKDDNNSLNLLLFNIHLYSFLIISLSLSLFFHIFSINSIIFEFLLFLSESEFNKIENIFLYLYIELKLIFSLLKLNIKSIMLFILILYSLNFISNSFFQLLIIFINK